MYNSFCVIRSNSYEVEKNWKKAKSRFHSTILVTESQSSQREQFVCMVSSVPLNEGHLIHYTLNDGRSNTSTQRITKSDWPFDIICDKQAYNVDHPWLVSFAQLFKAIFEGQQNWLEQDCYNDYQERFIVIFILWMKGSVYFLLNLIFSLVKWVM